MESAKTIYVIDDDKCLLEVIALALEDEGYIVRGFEDCTGLEENIDGQAPNLILMDCWLPGRGGDEVAMELKKNEKTKKIPIVLISASHNLATMAKQSKADDYLEKPFNISDLIGVVEKFTNKP